MSVKFIIAAAVTLVLALPLTSQAQRRNRQPAKPAFMLDTDGLQGAGFKKFWEAKLPLVSGDEVKDAFLVEEAIYVTTKLGSVYALVADVGLIRWAEHLTDADFTIFAPTHLRQASGQGPVVIPTTTATFIYNRYTGELIQRFTPPFATGGPAVGYDNNIFMGSTGGRLYSLIVDPKLAQPMVKWEVMASGPISAAPLLYDRYNLLIASQGGLVASCFAKDKAYQWSYKTSGPILGDPAVDATGVYVASMDRSVYKINKSLGIPVWRTRFPRPLDKGPTVIGGRVYQYCEGKGLTALDASNEGRGKELWVHPDGIAFAAHSDGADVILTSKRALDVVEPQTGSVRASIAAPGVMKVISNGVDSSVYALAADGTVICARMDSTPYLRRQQIISARNQLNQPPIDNSALIRPTFEKKEVVDPLENDPLRSRRDLDNPKPRTEPKKEPD